MKSCIWHGRRGEDVQELDVLPLFLLEYLSLDVVVRFLANAEEEKTFSLYFVASFIQHESDDRFMFASKSWKTSPSSSVPLLPSGQTSQIAKSFESKEGRALLASGGSSSSRLSLLLAIRNWPFFTTYLLMHFSWASLPVIGR